MVGDPGIEPGVSLLGGVTVPCRTLQPAARTLVPKWATCCERLDSGHLLTRQPENPLRIARARFRNRVSGERGQAR